MNESTLHTELNAMMNAFEAHPEQPSYDRITELQQQRHTKNYPNLTTFRAIPPAMSMN